MPDKVIRFSRQRDHRRDRPRRQQDGRVLHFKRFFCWKFNMRRVLMRYLL